MSDIINKLRGNGEPWTFAEIIEHIIDLRTSLWAMRCECDDAPCRGPGAVNCRKTMEGWTRK